MEGDVFDLGSIHFLAVLFSEEEPVGESHVKQLRVVSVESHEIQPLSVAVPASEEGSWLPLLPRFPTCLLD